MGFVILVASIMIFKGVSDGSITMPHLHNALDGLYICADCNQPLSLRISGNRATEELSDGYSVQMRVDRVQDVLRFSDQVALFNGRPTNDIERTGSPVDLAKLTDADQSITWVTTDGGSIKLIKQ